MYKNSVKDSIRNMLPESTDNEYKLCFDSWFTFPFIYTKAIQPQNFEQWHMVQLILFEMPYDV